MAKMSSKTFLEQELIPGVIASLMKNHTQSETTIKLIQKQYFGDTDYGDTRHFVPRFSQVTKLYDVRAWEMRKIGAKNHLVLFFNPSSANLSLFSFEENWRQKSYCTIFWTLPLAKNFSRPPCFFGRKFFPKISVPFCWPLILFVRLLFLILK